MAFRSVHVARGVSMPAGDADDLGVVLGAVVGLVDDFYEIAGRVVEEAVLLHGHAEFETVMGCCGGGDGPCYRVGWRDEVVAVWGGFGMGNQGCEVVQEEGHVDVFDTQSDKIE